jgi:hypothetical protein
VATPSGYDPGNTTIDPTTGQTRVTGTPLAAAPAPAAPPAEMTPAQAAAAGLGWVDKNHPLYGTAGYVGAPAAAAAPGATGSTPTGTAPGGANTIPGQAAAASTYSATPGAAPTQNTTNQGTQDVVRNSYLARATAPPNVDPNSQAIRGPADAFAAAQERARRDASSSLAEGMAGSGMTGAQAVEQRLVNERSSQARAGFEADLVRQEIQTKRDEAAEALKMLAGQISDDQARALQKIIADMDAQLKTQSLQSSVGLGERELALKDKLGMMGGNLDLMGMLMNNSQFNKNMGFNIGDREAYWNQVNLENILG